MNNVIKTARPRGTDSAKIVQVIETRSIKGYGTEGDPCRQLIQYWSLEGKLLCEKDPYEDEKSIERGIT